MIVHDKQVIQLLNGKKEIRTVYEQRNGLFYACVRNKILELRRRNDGTFYEVGLAKILTHRYNEIPPVKYHKIGNERKWVKQQCPGVYFTAHKGYLYLVHKYESGLKYGNRITIVESGS